MNIFVLLNFLKTLDEKGFFHPAEKKYDAKQYKSHVSEAKSYTERYQNFVWNLQASNR